MTTPSSAASPRAAQPAPAFHAGEQALQHRVGVRDRMAAIGPLVLRDHMPDQHRELFENLPTLLLGAIDAAGQPWATMVAGPPGFVHTPDARTLQVAVQPDAADPALAQLAGPAHHAPVGVLGLEPHTRRRNRMNGRVAAFGPEGLVVDVVQSFGNCPKYIQARAPGLREVVTPPAPAQPLGQALDAAALALIARSDTLFIASASAARPGAERNEGVDISHRGGEPGFVHVAHSDAGGVVLSVPDYPGNLFFNTLGNLALHPLAGLLWVDYDGGGLLHVAARAELLWDEVARAPWPGAERVLRLHVLGGVWRAQALPWRWTAAQAAPQFGVLRARAAG